MAVIWHIGVCDIRDNTMDMRNGTTMACAKSWALSTKDIREARRRHGERLSIERVCPDAHAVCCGGWCGVAACSLCPQPPSTLPAKLRRH